MENIGYKDHESYIDNKDDKVDYKFILMRQIDKIRLSRSFEMRGGHQEKQIISIGGGFMENLIYIPDSREVYINSVKIFSILLVIHFDEKYNGAIEKIDFKDKDKDQLVECYDDIFKELVILMHRKGLISQSKTVSDKA